ncbi:hypothetical protein ACFQ0B_77620 [Nonomuraea thailandensis]
MACEAQLSPITNDDIQRRTDRHTAEQIACCWVSSRDRVPWLSTIPGIAATPAQPPESVERWMVYDGVVTFDPRRGAWIQVDGVTLPTLVRWVLDGGLLWHSVGRRYRRIHLPKSNATLRRSVGWTTQRSIDAETAYEAMRQRQEAAKRARQERERQAAEHREQQRRQQEQARQQELARREHDRQEQAAAQQW